MEATPEIRFLGDMQRLKPEPGDVFVLMCDGHLSEQGATYLRNSMTEALNGAKVLVLTSGLRIGCVAAAPEDDYVGEPHHKVRKAF